MKTVRKLRMIVNQISSFMEYLSVRAFKKISGMSIVVRYLRNPNENLTVRLLRAYGAQVGELTKFKGSLILDNVYQDKNSKGDFRHLRVGNNCYIGEDVYLDLADEIVIEDNVVLSGRVSIITHADCNRSQYLEKEFPRKCQGVRVENGAWMGFGATLLCGVVAGEESVVAAGSVVTGNVESRSVYAGTPAKRVRKIGVSAAT